MPQVRRHMDVPTTTRAITLIQEGYSQRSVALQLGFSRRAVQNAWNRFQETGRVSRRPGSGRTRATTAQEDRYIRLSARRERSVTARALQSRLRQATGTRVALQTLRNRLHEDQQFSRRRVVRIPLTSTHRASRLAFARQHLEWDVNDWSSILFTDECKVKFCSDDRRIRVWRRKGERFSDACIHESNRFGGPSVMVWGGISLTGKTELVILSGGTVTAQRYVDEVIRPHVVPFAQRMGPGFMLMQDNARAHTARVTRDALQDAQISVLPWPANCPDLNPIEYMWDLLKRTVRQTNQPVHNESQLINVLKTSWEQIPLDTVRHLIQNMSSRLQDCAQKRGEHTRY